MTTSCKTNQQVIEGEEAKTLISYKRVKARCMHCPQFSIKILDNQTAKYMGHANVPLIGEQIISLSKKQFQNIISQFEQSDFAAFEPLYLTKKRDAPRLILNYQGHKVNTQEKACPESLMDLIELIESIKPK